MVGLLRNPRHFHGTTIFPARDRGFSWLIPLIAVLETEQKHVLCTILALPTTSLVADLRRGLHCVQIHNQFGYFKEAPARFSILCPIQSTSEDGHSFEAMFARPPLLPRKRQLFLSTKTRKWLYYQDKRSSIRRK
jgi:hypothetical protein